jgi:hypothetical protein
MAWQSASPLATRGAHALRCASWSLPYPRVCLLPGFGMATPGDDEGPAQWPGLVESAFGQPAWLRKLTTP